MAIQQRKKLEGNGFWESSRMMLPEHKVRINELAIEQKKRQRIELDEQEWEDVSRTVENRFSCDTRLNYGCITSSKSWRSSASWIALISLTAALWLMGNGS